MADAPEAQITANLILLMVPPVPVHTVAAALNRNCPPDAPAVHVFEASGLPDDEYPFASVTSLVTLEMIESVAVAAFDADV
jgi:hypothetical protein